MNSITNGSTPYGRDFYLHQQDGSLRSAQIVLPILLEAFRAESVADLGCGVGAWLSVARACGLADILGIDGNHVDKAMLKIPEANFLAADLRHPPKLARTFDLALCLEVAEHLPPNAADALVAYLTSLAPVIAFSAAIPGQGGTDHLNEQWQEFWRSKFRIAKFQAYDAVRPLIWSNRNVEFWYRQNIICYVHEDMAGSLGMAPVPDHISLDLVHPELLALSESRSHMYFSKAVAMLPRLARQAVARRLGQG